MGKIQDPGIITLPYLSNECPDVNLGCILRKFLALYQDLSVRKMPSYDYNDYNDDSEENEMDRRFAWEVTSWILVALTLVLNLAVVAILLFRENAYSVVNKGISFTCLKVKSVLILNDLGLDFVHLFAK